MSRSAVTNWTSLVKVVAKLVDSPRENVANVQEAAVQIFSLKREASMPQAVWKKLILEQKIPKALAQLCVRALQRHPHSFTQLLANNAMSSLLESAVEGSALAPGTRLAAAILQQLQDAGFLQHLPELMAHAVQDLTVTAAAALAPDLRNSDAPCSSSSAARRPMSSGLGVTGRVPGTTQGLLDLDPQQAVTNSTHLMMISVNVTALWSSTGDVPVWLHHAPALLQLVLAVFETVHKLQGQPQSSPAMEDMWHSSLSRTVSEAMHVFCETTRKLRAYLNHQAGQGTSVAAASSTAELLRSPELHRCFTLMTCVGVAGTCSSGGSSSGNSRDNGSSSSSGSASRGSTSSSSRGRASKGNTSGSAGGSSSSGAKHPVTQRQDRQQSSTAAAARPAQVQEATAAGQGTAEVSAGAAFGFPVSLLTNKLFKELGVGPAAVMYIAKEAILPSQAFAGLQRLVNLYADLSDQGRAAAGSDVAPTDEQLGRVETSFLLSLLLLQWVDALPANCTDLGDASLIAALLTSIPVHDLESAQTRHKALHRQQQQQQPQPPHAPQQQPLLPPSAILAELLPLLIKLCKGRLHHLLQRQQQSPQQGQRPPQQLPSAESVSVSQLCQRGSFVTVSPSNDGRAGYVLKNVAGMLLGLIEQCAVEPDGDQSMASAHGVTMLVRLPRDEAIALEAAREAARVSASSSATAPRNILHSQQLFAGHAGDITAIVEGNLRYNVSAAGLLASAAVAGAEVAVQTAALLLARIAAPGSAVQQQSFSLMATLLKLGAGQVGQCPCLPGICFAVAEGAAGLLSAPAAQALAEQQPAGSLTGSAAISLLPSLTVLGRFFLYMLALVTTRPGTATPSAPLQLARQACMSYCFFSGRLAGLVRQVQRWLQAHSQQLAAAGYASPAVLQQLEQLAGALRAAVTAQHQQLLASIQAEAATGAQPASSPARFDGAEVLHHLELTGLALCSLPVPCLCNNPSCTNMAGLTELGLVSGRSCICGGCRVARYCSRACQRATWRQHKPLCAVLAAAAAAASPELPAGLEGAEGS